MVQKIPYGSGYSRWWQTITFSNTATPSITVLVPPRSYVIDPLTGIKFATSTSAGSTTTLNDSGRTWLTNMWANKWVRIVSGTGSGQTSLIASNTATQLTFATIGTAPDNTSVYCIMDDRGYAKAQVLVASSGITRSTATGNFATTTLGDSAASWALNQWAGYEVYVVSGTDAGQYARIKSNTATVLTFSPAFSGATDGTTVYEIYEPKCPRPVLTDFDISGQQTATTGSTISIQSFDTGVTTDQLTRTLVTVAVASTQIFVANTDLYRVGLPNGCLRIVGASLNTTSTFAVNLGGYWLDPNEPSGVNS